MLADEGVSPWLDACANLPPEEALLTGRQGQLPQDHRLGPHLTSQPAWLGIGIAWARRIKSAEALDLLVIREEHREVPDRSSRP